MTTLASIVTPTIIFSTVKKVRDTNQVRDKSNNRENNNKLYVAKISTTPIKLKSMKGHYHCDRHNIFYLKFYISFI